MLKDKLKKEFPGASKIDIEAIDFGPFPELEDALKSDVEFLKSHPLILKESVISGWIYEVETGKVRS
jgi:carbonic anhydrase